MQTLVDLELPECVDVIQQPHAPLIIEVKPFGDSREAMRWLEASRDALRHLLLKHGHFMIRGLSITSSEDFVEVRDIMVAERASYNEKATPRSKYGDDIFSSTDMPASHTIQLHNENSYTLKFPGILLFCCLEASDTGGATTVANVREVLARIPPQLVERFRHHGWLLKRNYYPRLGLPWTVAFDTTDKQVVERYCANNLIGARWMPGDILQTTQRRTAIITHPQTQEEIWFNHVAFWSKWSLPEQSRAMLIDSFGDDGLPFDTAMGNGELLSEQEVRMLQDAYASAQCRESWRRGDILLVDNILSAHGREAFTGRRKILVAMGEPVAIDLCKPTIAAAPV